MYPHIVDPGLATFLDPDAPAPDPRQDVAAVAVALLSWAASLGVLLVVT